MNRAEMSVPLPDWYIEFVLYLRDAPHPAALGTPDHPLLVPGWVIERYGLMPIAGLLHHNGVESWQIVS